MGRGVSSGGGQSSLGYLFGGPEEGGSKPVPVSKGPAQDKAPQNLPPAGISRVPAQDRPPAGVPTEHDTAKPLEVGNTLGRNSNNYHRAEGQNTGNFITVSISDPARVFPDALCLPQMSLSTLFVASTGASLNSDVQTLALASMPMGMLPVGCDVLSISVKLLRDAVACFQVVVALLGLHRSVNPTLVRISSVDLLNLSDVCMCRVTA